MKVEVWTCDDGALWWQRWETYIRPPYGEEFRLIDMQFINGRASSEALPIMEEAKKSGRLLDDTKNQIQECIDKAKEYPDGIWVVNFNPRFGRLHLIQDVLKKNPNLEQLRRAWADFLSVHRPENKIKYAVLINYTAVFDWTFYETFEEAKESCTSWYNEQKTEIFLIEDYDLYNRGFIRHLPEPQWRSYAPKSG